MDISNFSDQFRNLDPDNIGNWPIAVRGLIVFAVLAAGLAAGYYFDTEAQLKKLEMRQSEESRLKADFEKKQKKAASLDAYKAQMAEMEESFGTMLRQLPSKTEVADLLVDITQTGLASGLDFELFKPEGEVPKEFYAELPIDLKVIGHYHDLGQFVSGVAALPRIVTLHEINVQTSRNTDQLTMTAIAKTYRYLDEEEIEATKQPANRRRRR